MKSAIIVFPGINRERDMARALKLISGREPAKVWHADTTLPPATNLVVLPGGFSYGDYLRCRAIARFSPVMASVIAAARDGLPVLGICNGFQVLCESHLLPGALVRNDHRKFVCRDQRLRIERTSTAWTSAYTPGEEIVVPLKNGEGAFVADPATLDRLEGEGRVVARYVDVNPNGSHRDIAGISNASGTVVGLMPHPEHATEPLFGPDRDADGRFENTDGVRFFTSALASLLAATAPYPVGSAT